PLDVPQDLLFERHDLQPVTEPRVIIRRIRGASYACSSFAASTYFSGRCATFARHRGSLSAEDRPGRRQAHARSGGNVASGPEGGVTGRRSQSTAWRTRVSECLGALFSHGAPACFAPFRSCTIERGVHSYCPRGRIPSRQARHELVPRLR